MARTTTQIGEFGIEIGDALFHDATHYSVAVQNAKGDRWHTLWAKGEGMLAADLVLTAWREDTNDGRRRSNNWDKNPQGMRPSLRLVK